MLCVDPIVSLDNAQMDVVSVKGITRGTRVRVGVGDGVGVRVGVGDGVGVRVGVGDGVDVFVGSRVAVGLGVGGGSVFVGAGGIVGVSVGVRVAVGVAGAITFMGALLVASLFLDFTLTDTLKSPGELGAINSTLGLSPGCTDAPAAVHSNLKSPPPPDALTPKGILPPGVVV